MQIKLADDVRAFNLQGQGVDEDPIGVMSINEETGEITVYKAVDYEEYPFLRVGDTFTANSSKLIFFSRLLSISDECASIPADV